MADLTYMGASQSKAGKERRGAAGHVEARRGSARQAWNRETEMNVALIVIGSLYLGGMVGFFVACLLAAAKE